MPHRECPDCRERAGKAAHVVDASWRVHLLIDGLASSWKALPRRIPALAGILFASLLLPLGVYALAAPETSDWSDGGAVAFAFACGAFFLGTFLQPLLVLPMIERTKKARVVAGAVLGSFTAFAPLVVIGVVAAVTIEGGSSSDAEIIGQLVGFFMMAVAAVTMTTGLVWQGRVVLGRGPGLAGLFGAVVAHFCAFGLWGTLLSAAVVPAAIAVVIGVVVSPVVAGVIGVVAGVFLWLAMLVGMGAFAAGSARYSDDLERLS